MENEAPRMSNETVHKVLSRFVSQQIMNSQYDLSYVEWVKIMNSYNKHESIQQCADALKLRFEDVQCIYYAFTMCIVNYAMDHPQ